MLRISGFARRIAFPLPKRWPALKLLVATALVLSGGVSLRGAEGVELEKAVKSYWDHLLTRHKQQAAAYVAEASLEAFHDREEPFFRSWRVVSVERISDRQRKVQVEVDRLVDDGFFAWKLEQSWVLDGGGWKVRIGDGSAKRLLWLGRRPRKAPAGALEISPQIVKFHFLGRAQSRSIQIRNGRPETLHLLDVDYPKDRFELLERFDVVEPGGIGSLVLRFKGSQTAKELASELRLTYRIGSRDEARRIPILYNHLSAGARGLFGLTRQRAEDLKPGQSLMSSAEIARLRFSGSEAREK